MCGYPSVELQRRRSGTGVSRDRDRRDHEAASSRKNLVLDVAKTNDRKSRIVIEVASNGVANRGLQLFHGFCLSKNGVSERPSFIPPSGESCTEKMISLSVMPAIILSRSSRRLLGNRGETSEPELQIGNGIQLEDGCVFPCTTTRPAGWQCLISCGAFSACAFASAAKPPMMMRIHVAKRIACCIDLTPSR
jgi:hypothetical protein